MQARGGSLYASVRFIKNGETHAGMPVFVNQYGTPETGDHALDLPALLAALSLALAAVWITLWERRKAKRQQ